MPGDPQECRRHALTCVRLAQTSASPQAREEFASLANTWLRLATDLETFLDPMDDTDEPIRRTG
jgi:hypothetical protein